MSKLWQKLRHEPVAFWTGLLTVIVAVLTATGIFPEVAGVLTAIITVLGGGIVRSQVTPTAADPEAGGDAATAPS